MERTQIENKLLRQVAIGYHCHQQTNFCHVNIRDEVLEKIFSIVRTVLSL